MISTPPAINADYGLDAPGVVRTMLTAGVLLVLLSLILSALHVGDGSLDGLWRAAFWMGVSFAATGGLMILSSRVGKLRARDRLLSRLALRGDETVLDIGCGHGLLLLGAAHLLPRGRAIGVDLWSQTDQQHNSAEATLANAEREGVRQRVDIRGGDMRGLPLDDDSVDGVVSSLAIHNVPSPEGRARAVDEIARVLRPGGRVALLDIAHVSDYARVLREHGFTIERLGLSPWIFPPARELVARAPA